jgi:hypothetical protein
MAPRFIFWQRLDKPGSELARLREEEEGFELSGTVLLFLDGTGWEIGYEIEGDALWRTRRVSVSCRGSLGDRALLLEADGEGHWTRGGETLAPVEGSLDVDLSFSPATNTLPIRRLALTVGGAAPVRAAWILFPSLEVKPLEQTYTRETERRYRYGSSTGFRTSIEVDEAGLVTEYPGLWKALPSGAR